MWVLLLVSHHLNIITVSNQSFESSDWSSQPATRMPAGRRAGGCSQRVWGWKKWLILKFTLKEPAAGSSKSPWRDQVRIQNHQLRISVTELQLHCSDSDVFMLNPEGVEEPVKVLEMENGIFECNYYPIMTGKYMVTITWGGHSIPRRWDISWSFYSPVCLFDHWGNIHRSEDSSN